MGIDKQTGEITYPYLDGEGRVICDPKPLTVAVGITQIGMDENRIPATLYEGFDVDGDGDFDVVDEDEVLPLTDHEIAALNLPDREVSSVSDEGTREEEGDSQPPLE